MGDRGAGDRRAEAASTVVVVHVDLGDLRARAVALELGEGHRLAALAHGEHLGAATEGHLARLGMVGLGVASFVEIQVPERA